MIKFKKRSKSNIAPISVAQDALDAQLEVCARLLVDNTVFRKYIKKVMRVDPENVLKEYRSVGF